MSAPPLALHIDTCLFMPSSIVCFLKGVVVLHWAPAEEQRTASLRIWRTCKAASSTAPHMRVRAALAEKGERVLREHGLLDMARVSSLEFRLWGGGAEGTGLACNGLLPATVGVFAAAQHAPST